MGRRTIPGVGSPDCDSRPVLPPDDQDDDPVAMPGADAVVVVSGEVEAFHYMRHWVEHLIACHPGTFLANAAGWNNLKH